MTKPARSPRHLATVRSRPCCLRGLGMGQCSGPVEAHHAFGSATGGGKALKGSDFAAVPLCVLHHRRVHAEPVPIAWLVEMAVAAIRLAVDEGFGAMCEMERRRATSAKALRLALGRAVGEVVEAVEELASDGR